jgi:hypothetical protein
MEVSGRLHAPAALPPEKEFPVSIGEEVGWTLSYPGPLGEENDFLQLQGIPESAHILVAVLREVC